MELAPKVLVIDDEPMLLRAIQRMLCRDHTVTATVDACEALRMLQDGDRFAAILCDMKMPRMNGRMFFEQLLEVAPDQTSRVIFLTGDSMSDQSDFFSALENAVVTKPFVVTTLRDVVAMVVRSSEFAA